MTQRIFTRNFVLCFFAQFAFTSVFHILVPTLPIYLSKSGASEVEIGVLIGIFGISSLIIRPIVGRGLIKIPEKNFMIAGTLIFALTSIAYLWAAPFWPFFVVRIIQGIGLAFFYTASVTLVTNISPVTRRGQSISYFYLAFNISFALSPSLGMLLINNFSFTLLFLFCLGLSLCALFLTTRLERGEVESIENRPDQDSSFLSQEALPVAIMSFFAHAVWGALTAFFPLFAIEKGVANPGLFFAAYAIVIILGRVFGGKILDLYSRERVILPCLFTYIISMTLLAFSETLPMFILVAMIWGIGNAFLMPSLVTYALDRAGSSRGPAIATLSAIGDLGIALGPVVMGIILRWTNYPVMFLFLTLTGLINLIYFYFFVRKGDR